MVENEDLKILPEPEQTGSKEIQEKNKDIVEAYPLEGTAGGGLDQYPLTTVVKGITDFGIKGNAAMALLFASTKRIESDLNDERTDRKKIMADCDSWKEKYFQQKENNSILKERLVASTKIKTLQSVFLTLGGIIGGIGIKNLMEEFTGISVTLSIFGLCLLVCGWFWPNYISKEDKS